jgi:MFS family permease
MAVETSQPLPIVAKASARWVQLGLGLIAMMAISSPQYVWTLFTKSFQDNLGATLPAIQITFSVVIVLQTWLSPLQGYLVDKFGPRLLIALGCLLSGAGWVLSAQATSLTGLYLTYGLFCGIGTGIVYVGIIGLMVRWFPDRRGLATGVVAAGYGFGAIATTFPIDSMLKSAGYQHTLVVFGIILGLVGAAAALAMRMPNGGDVLPAAPAMTRSRDVAPRQMLRAGVLAAVRDDDDDVDRRVDDHLAIRRLLARFRRRERPRVRPRGIAVGLDGRSHHQRPDPAVFRLAVGPDRA